MFLIDDFLPLLIGASCVAAAAGVYFRARHLKHTRAQHLRAQGYRLIHALGEYSAWIDYQRDLPFTARSPDELSLPGPLAQACRIKSESFPDLSQPMVLLLQAHSRVIEYLWQQNLVRLTQGSGWLAAHEDKQYQQLRGAQEELIDDMIAQCRELIGDASEPWRRTGSDFAFTNSSLGWPATSPHRRA